MRCTMNARSMGARITSCVGEVLPRLEPARDVRPSHARVALEQLGGGRLRRLDELHVLFQIREAQQRLAALPLAEDLAGPAQLEIALGDREAVDALVDDLQPLARQLGDLP